MPLLKRVRQLAAKIETSVGVAISLSASDATNNCYDIDLQPDVPVEDRQGQTYFGRLSGVPGARTGKATFKTPISGTGAGGVPVWASTFLPACGWVASSQVYSPKSLAPGSSTKTITIATYENGVKKQLRGCMGTFKIMLPTGRLAYFDWEFTGIWDGQTDVSLLSPTLDTNLPFRYASSTTTIGSFAPKIESLTIDAGNVVIMREDAADVSGYASALITDRKVVGSINPEASLVATYDPYGDWLSATLRALSATVGNGTDVLTVAAPDLQITKVAPGDRGDNQIDQIDFSCIRSSGDDELTLTFAAP